jgi:SAM-dependent methyltransferase
MFYRNVNDIQRQVWLRKTLAAIPAGARILDAGAGELRNRALCAHLQYVSQDFCQYDGRGDGTGIHGGTWDTSRIDLVCDITSIPEPDGTFVDILCTEVLEHVPDPTDALDEFRRLLKTGGTLILTAPFASAVHMAPYHYCSGFSRYWYEHHLASRGLEIVELTANGDWFSCCEQELMRLGGTARQRGDWAWPAAYVLGMLGALYFKVRGGRSAEDMACFGWHCTAVRK